MFGNGYECWLRCMILVKDIYFPASLPACPPAQADIRHSRLPHSCPRLYVSFAAVQEFVYFLLHAKHQTSGIDQPPWRLTCMQALRTTWTLGSIAATCRYLTRRSGSGRGSPGRRGPDSGATLPETWTQHAEWRFHGTRHVLLTCGAGSVWTLYPRMSFTLLGP